MLDSTYSGGLRILLDILTTLVDFFKTFFDVIVQDVWTLISSAPLPDWFINALDIANVDGFLSQFSLLGLLFSLYIVYLCVGYFFIP